MKYNTKIFSTKSEMLAHLAAALQHTIRETLQHQDVFRIVIGGGRTQEALNKEIIKLEKYALNWRRVFIYLSDERCVPPDHEHSNFGMNLSTLVTPLDMPLSNIHRIHTELGAEKAAARYSALLENIPECRNGPLFDLALLGLGPDGHTASLFPGDPALDATDSMATAAGPGPEGRPRVTLTYPALNASRKVWIMATGREKKYPVAKMMNGPHDPKTWPVQGVRPITGGMTLWLDAAAA